MPLKFSCTLCGDCCTGQQVVRLTGHDLHLLVDRSGLASILELKRHGVTVVREPVGGGRFAWRPRIRFRSRPLVQCPFLVNDVTTDGAYRGLCSLHPHHKPLVCRLAPLTREVVDPGQGPVSESWSAVPPVEGCPGMGQGDDLLVAAPADLTFRLDEEIRWMRYLIAGSAQCPDEASAWELLGRWTAAP